MKRRVISVITILALCLSLWPGQAFAIPARPTYVYKVNTNDMIVGPYTVARDMVFDTNGYSYTATQKDVISVSGYVLYLTDSAGAGKLISNNGSGVTVGSGAFLCVEDTDITVTGATYALNISSGAEVQLFGGTYTATNARGTAIYAADGDYGALLAEGYAYFSGGSAISPEDVAGLKEVSVGRCTNHAYEYAPDPGRPTHTGVCRACGAEVTVACTFDFVGSANTAECAVCGHMLTITVDETALGDLVYDGGSKPGDSVADAVVTVEVDGTTLTRNTDYTLECTTRSDVGIITVTVTGITYHGTPFTRDFDVTQATPVLKWNWDEAGPVEVEYDGKPVDDLPEVLITAPDAITLQGLLAYSYRKTPGNADFTPGLPTDAGTYEIKASLPEQQNYHAAETDPCLQLTIRQMPAEKVIPATGKPVATKPVYKYDVVYKHDVEQTLVTAGEVNPDAVGAVIQFAESANGPWSTSIPTGTNAGNYEVWYKVDGTDNYESIVPTQVLDVQIQRKPVTPVVDLEYTSIVYDGGEKEPGVKVTDPDDDRLLQSTEYTVEYRNNQNVGDAKVIVSDADNGNYEIKTVEKTFKITAMDQAALSITGQPDKVTYGDVFVLGTVGGSGDGTVTWKIIDEDGHDIGENENSIAVIGKTTGQVTVRGIGTFTVQATKSDGTNHQDATATCSFTATSRPVTAVVTAESKTYDGKTTATVHAVVEQNVVFDDKITISLPGAFSDANAGTNKTVTVNTNEAMVKVEGTAEENYYKLTYSSTTVTADIYKVESRIKTAPTPVENLTYNGTAQELVVAAVTNNVKNVKVEYALSESGPYSENVPKATNAGDYEVWYRVPETTNYTGIPAAKVDVTIARKPVTPYVELESNTYIYDGKAKEPEVTAKDGNTEIPSSEYTVTYKNNIEVGKASVIVEDKAGGNYDIQTTVVTFEITKGNRAELIKLPEALNPVYNGSMQDLVKAGDALNGHLEYSVGDENNYSQVIPQEENASTYKVYYKVKGDANHEDFTPATNFVEVIIYPKPVNNPTIELDLKNFNPEYDGTPKTPAVLSVKDGNTEIEAKEYTVTYSNNENAGTATVHITDKPGGNYTVNGTADFTIEKAGSTVTEAPKAKEDLYYTALEQELLETRGSATGGTIVYSLDGGAYSQDIPKAAAVGQYSIQYKVLGDSNHNDSAPRTVTVSIGKNKVTTPTIELSSYTFKYNGNQQKPTVTVRDDKNRLIAENEYVVEYPGGMIEVGEYTLTVTTPDDSNYIIDASNTRSFKIVRADQETTSITGMPDEVFYGDKIQLSVTGGTGVSTVKWSVKESGNNTDKVTITEYGGLLEVKGVGSSFVVTAIREASASYEETSTTWEFGVSRKPVTPTITVAEKPYDTTDTATLTATWKSGDLVFGDSLPVAVTGKFLTPDVGTNKPVEITAMTPDGDTGNYTIIRPASVTGTIYKADAKLKDAPKPANGLIYTGSPQALLTSGSSTVGNIGVVEYSLSEKGVYSSDENTLKATEAGSYEVWYRVLESENYTGIPASKVDVTIAPKPVENPDIALSKDSYDYDGTAKEPTVKVKESASATEEIPSTEYTVAYSDNVNAGTATVTVTAKEGGNYTFNAVKTFTIEKANVTSVTPPTGKMGLLYNGTAQELITRGSSPDGKMVYSLDGTDYSEDIPTAVAVNGYTIYYKVLGDDNHNDRTPDTVTASITKNSVTNPTITLSTDSFTYNGNQQKPTITVYDDKNFLIAEKEYVVTITKGDDNTPITEPIDIGTYTITITAKEDSVNYDIQGNNTRTYIIYPVDQEGITITGKRDRVYYGDTIQLSVTGGTGTGTVTWTVTENGNTNKVAITENGGLLTVNGVGGPFVVTATRKSANYGDISTTWEFSTSPKPVTAILTGVDRDYEAGVKTVTVKAKVASSDLVGNDVITIPDLTGYFEDANVGTSKKITNIIPPDSTDVTGASNYVITYPDTAYASIKPVQATVKTPPTAVTNPVPTYEVGKASELVTEGEATGGTMVYSLDGNVYTPAIPTGTSAGTYTVYYKVQGDSNHTDSVVGKVTDAKIDPKPVTPQIELNPPSAPYDGTVKRPEVIVRDDVGHVIPEGEYQVTYDSGTDWKSVRADHTVKITDIAGGNYTISSGEKAFEITEAEPNSLEIVNKPGLVRYGDSFTLSAMGGYGDGEITWSSDNSSVATVNYSSGLVEVKGVGTVRITATKAATANYSATTAEWSFTTQKKPVTAIVTAENKPYDGTATATLHVTWRSGALVSGDSIATSGLSGTFADANVGTDKNVTINGSIADTRYEVTVPATTTASITPAPTTVDGISLIAATNLMYTGEPQALIVSPYPTVTGGDLAYSLDGSNYSLNIPTAINAKTYTVWYKVQGDSNHTDSAPKTVLGGVTIEKAKPVIDVNPTASAITVGQTLKNSKLTGGSAVFKGLDVPGTFAWKDSSIEHATAGTYTDDVTFTPTDKINFTPVEGIQVTVEIKAATDPDNSSGGDTEDTESNGDGQSTTPSETPSAGTDTQPNVGSVPAEPGTASVALDTAAGEELVKEASQSKNVVIKPEMSGDVTKAEVSLPAEAVGRIGNETEAALTVSTPVADVTIPNSALGTLSAAGGEVSVVTEQVDNTVVLTLTADGKAVEKVPGGLTLTVPAADAGPGTVAVLVHADGTRETIRWSIAEDGTVRIPLSGSATVEIVDNSKAFVDVPSESWAFDAVAFASAHELFSGTGEATFSPEQTMSRGMLATVLYNLEGKPEQSLTDEFSDVSADAWYANGVAWATANGVAGGYDDGQFGPDDSITREQFAVMLWRYAGKPAAEEQALSFADADQISGYAVEALRWATANGVLNGHGDGQLDPTGLATRAQAAQILKNFMENM